MAEKDKQPILPPPGVLLDEGSSFFRRKPRLWPIPPPGLGGDFQVPEERLDKFEDTIARSISPVQAGMDAAEAANRVLPALRTGDYTGAFGDAVMAAAPFVGIKPKIPARITSAPIMKAEPVPKGLGFFNYRGLDRVPDVPQVVPERYDPFEGRRRGLTPRVEQVLNDPAVWRGLSAAIDRGTMQGMHRWWRTPGIADVWNDIAGNATSFPFYGGHLAGTSAGQPVQKNIPVSTYYWTLRKPPQVGDPIPEGYGAKTQKLHQELINELRTEGQIDPLEHAKMATMAQNAVGNEAGVTLDTHATRLPGILSKDPRWLATQVQLGNAATGHYDINPRALHAAGRLSVEDALKRASFWDNMPNTAEYKPLEGLLWTPMAERKGLTPAAAQAGAWVGGGNTTGLKSPPVPLQLMFERKLFETAQALGKTPMQVMRDLVKKKAPFIPAGAVTAPVAGTMLDYGLDDAEPEHRARGGAADDVLRQPVHREIGGLVQPAAPSWGARVVTPQARSMNTMPEPTRIAPWERPEDTSLRERRYHPDTIMNNPPPKARWDDGNDLEHFNNMMRLYEQERRRAVHQRAEGGPVWDADPLPPLPPKIRGEVTREGPPSQPWEWTKHWPQAAEFARGVLNYAPLAIGPGRGAAGPEPAPIIGDAVRGAVRGVVDKGVARLLDHYYPPETMYPQEWMRAQARRNGGNRGVVDAPALEPANNNRPLQLPDDPYTWAAIDKSWAEMAKKSRQPDLSVVPKEAAPSPPSGRPRLTAAVKVEGEGVYAKGPTHSDALGEWLAAREKAGLPEPTEADWEGPLYDRVVDGYVTPEGRFLTREEAARYIGRTGDLESSEVPKQPSPPSLKDILGHVDSVEAGLGYKGPMNAAQRQAMGRFMDETDHITNILESMPGGADIPKPSLDPTKANVERWFGGERDRYLAMLRGRLGPNVVLTPPPEQK